LNDACRLSRLWRSGASVSANHESAITLSALGLSGRLAEEIAAIHEVMGAIGERSISSENLTDLIGEVHRRRDEAAQSA
jgi:hypothetical protein